MKLVQAAKSDKTYLFLEALNISVFQFRFSNKGCIGPTTVFWAIASQSRVKSDTSSNSLKAIYPPVGMTVGPSLA